MRGSKTSSEHSLTQLQIGAAMQVAPLCKSEFSRMDQPKYNLQSSRLGSRIRRRAGRASHVTMSLEHRFRQQGAYPYHPQSRRWQ